MPLKRWHNLQMLALAIAVLLASTHVACAARLFCHRATRCNQCSLRPYAYGQDRTQNEIAVVAIAREGQPVSSPSAADGNRRRKHFYVIQREVISVDDIHLRRFGLSIDNDGRCHCTGVLSFDGNVEAAKLGANVELKVRFYMGTPQHPGSLDNMAMLCQTERPLWVPRGHSQAVSLLPTDTVDHSPPPPNRCCCTPKRDLHRSWEITRARNNLQQLVKANFEQITHIEIALVHRHDK